MPILASLITAVVSGEASDTIGRLRSTLVVYAVAGLLVLVALGFVVGAAFVATADELGTVTACLVFAGAFVALAVVMVIVYRLMSRVRARRVARRRSTEVKAVASATAIALLPTLLAGRARVALLGVPLLAALGYAVYQENKRPRGPGRTG